MAELYSILKHLQIFRLKRKIKNTEDMFEKSKIFLNTLEKGEEDGVIN